MAQIHITQWPQPIEAGRLRILEAALDAGVPFPHGCGTGECGSCKCKLLSGKVEMDRYSPTALSDEERERGLILACRSRVVSDVKVSWLASAAIPKPMVKFNARVFRVAPVAHDVYVVTLATPPGQGFSFHPGQFAKLRFGKLPARKYSMASQPGLDLLEFHIRIVPGGVVSQHVATQLRHGDMVEVRGPFGDAYWEGPEEPHTGPLVLLAGGTGLAPILSVLDAALQDGVAPEQVHLYHGVRAERDLYAASHLNTRAQEKGFRFTPVYSESGHANVRSGYVHQILEQDFNNLAHARIYVAGPPPMVDAVRASAVQRGADPQRIRADAFYASEPEKKSMWARLTGWGDL
ncbi:2Fe-2S iron-sulfur cluster binding domain-containing protein [Rhodoferax sp. 4810]|nr:2Fe-2S iron-sulfur cluster binding domain-containing protein [Rhodoferax jenense]